MGFNSAFKGLTEGGKTVFIQYKAGWAPGLV